MKKILLLLPLLVIFSACDPRSQPTQDVNAIVNATLTTVAQTAPAPTEIPSASAPTMPPMGLITGKLSYPSSLIPPMRVAFFNLTDGSVSYIDTGMNQGSYSTQLPVGTYHVVSYPYDANAAPAPSDSTLAGGYTAAVPCGLNVNCTDHSLTPVNIIAGQTAYADPGDWYAPPGSFPPMPTP